MLNETVIQPCLAQFVKSGLEFSMSKSSLMTLNMFWSERGTFVARVEKDNPSASPGVGYGS